MKATNLARLEAWSAAHKRRRAGNVMVLVAAITLGIIVAVILFALDYNQFLGASHQHLTAVESAGLAAAQDLSRIVVRDQNYGYIALTDYPPVGIKTIAGDGRPMPVTGINTIIGTARLDLLIAHQTGSANMVRMAEKDYDNAKAASRLLTDCLKNALRQEEAGATGTSKIAGDEGSDPKAGPWTDMDGNIINPFADAKRVYMANLTTMSNGGKPVVNTFKCSLGYLESGGSTLTHVPRPDDLSQCGSNQRQGEYYKAFINIPAHGKDFYFAGLSTQPALIDARQYRDDDGLRSCSAVRVEAEHSFERAESTSQQVFKTIACAEPSGTPDTTPPGVMTIAFPDGLTPGITTIRDLLTNGDLRGNTGTVAESGGGDWPFDGASGLTAPKPITDAGGDDSNPSAADMFAGGFYDWMRTGHVRPNIKKVKDFMNYDVKATLTADANDGVSKPWKFDWMQAAIAGVPPSPPSEAGMIYTGIMDNIPLDRWNTLLSKSADSLSAYDAIANYIPISTNLPDNAAEVKVDQNGNVMSTSGDAIDANYMGEFWRAVENTQTAAYQTMAVAQQGLLLNLGNAQLLNAKANAEAAVRATADMIKRQADYSSDGLTKNADGSFTYGGTAFTPHPTAAADAAAIMAGTDSSGAPSNRSWGSPSTNFKTFNPDEPDDNAPKPPTRNIKCKLLMVEFDADGNVVSTAMPSSPFCGLPVSDGQQLGVVYTAMHTPGNLTWSAVYRDQCHYWGRGIHGGQPLAGTPVDWCERSTFLFDLNVAKSKAKGQSILGIRVSASGAPPGLDGVGGSKYSSKGSRGKSSKGNPPLGGSGKGPRSAKPGVGDLAKDKVGFPWGFKYGGTPGEKWRTGDAKYQFPGGAEELGLGTGPSWGKVKKALNDGTAGITPTSAPYPPGGTVLPYGEQATFVPLGGGVLPQQPRANYYCGGMAFEFQLRGPIVTIDPSLLTSNGLGLSAGSGKATVAGIQVPVLGLGGTVDVTTSPHDIKKGTLDLNETTFTKPIPPAKASM